MGKGHSDRKKINKLLASGKIKEARAALEASKARVNAKGQRALSSKASQSLERHLNTQLKMRKKMGVKKYNKMVSDRSEAIRSGMSRSKTAREREQFIKDRRDRFTGG